jgi:hypothetical protein
MQESESWGETKAEIQDGSRGKWLAALDDFRNWLIRNAA